MSDLIFDKRAPITTRRYTARLNGGYHDSLKMTLPRGEIAATFTNGTLSSVEVPDFEGSDIRGNWLMRGYVAAWLEELCQQEQSS